MKPATERRQPSRLLLILALLAAAGGDGAAQARNTSVHTDPTQPARRLRGLQVGDPAPAFTLCCAGKPGQAALFDPQARQPVVLIFGSYT